MTWITATGNNVNSVTTGTVTAATGDTLYCQVANDHTITVNTPTGYTKQSAGELSQGAAALTVFTKENVSSGSTSVTVTFSANDFPSIIFANIGGTIGASAVDTGSRVQTTDATSTYDQTSNTLAQASETVIAGLTTDGGTNPMNYAESLLGGTIVKEDNGSSFWSSAVSYVDVSATTAKSVSWTHSGSSNGAAMHIIGVKLAAAAADMPPQPTLPDLPPTSSRFRRPSRLSRNHEPELGGWQSPPVGPDSFEAKALYHDALPPEGKRASRGYKYQLEGWQATPLSPDSFEAKALYHDSLPPEGRRAGRGYKYDLQAWQRSPLAADNSEALTFDIHDALAPTGRNYDYELEGWQRDVVSADNTEALSINAHFDLAPIGRNFDFELEGWQQDTVVDDNETATALTHLDLTPIGRDYDYELRGWQQSAALEFSDDDSAIARSHTDLTPLGRDYEWELKGFQHHAIGAAISSLPIVIVQQTAQQFFDDVTSASRTITGVTAHSNLIALFHYMDIDNSPSKSSYAPSSGWLTAEAPSGPVDANSFMGQSAIYYMEDVAAGDYTLSFSSLRPSTYCEITIVEVSGLAATNSLDVHGFGLSPSNTVVTAGSVGPTAPSTVANSIVFAGIGVSGGGTITNLSHPPTTYTDVDVETTNATHICYDSAYKIVSATGAQSADWTWTITSNYTATLAVFKGAAEAPPPTDIAANWSALTPDGRNFDYQLEAWQSAPQADDNDVPTSAAWFAQLPIGRDFDYELAGWSFPPAGPDFIGDDALTNGLQDFDPAPIGDDFDYQLEGFQQGVVGADANQDNVMPQWFEVPQTVVNYGHHLAPFSYSGVGPDGTPLFSEVTKWTDGPPVLLIPEIEEWMFLPIVDDAVPLLDSNALQWFENPPSFLQLFPDIDAGFTFGSVVADFATVLTSEPSIVDELPFAFLHPAPAYDSFYLNGIPADANFTDAVNTSHFALTPLGRDFDFDLTGYQAVPLSDDNETAIAAGVFDLTPTGRDFLYELVGYQTEPTPDENELAYSPVHADLNPDGRDFTYELGGWAQPAVVPDGVNDPLPLGGFVYELPREGRNFDYELAGWQYGIAPPEGPDLFPITSSVSYALPPIGRDFEFELTGFQSPPLSADYFEFFVLMGMIMPAYLEPKIDERDVTPFLGQQTSPAPGEILPFNNSGPSQYIPTYRPRRR